jgi:hypothetical protein
LGTLTPITGLAHQERSRNFTPIRSCVPSRSRSINHNAAFESGRQMLKREHKSARRARARQIAVKRGYRAIAALASLTLIKQTPTRISYQNSVADKDRFVVLLAVAIGLAAVVGLWLFGFWIAKALLG